MKRKIIYSFLLICCLGLFSSANQNDKDCGKSAICFSTKTNCCAGTSAAPVAEQNDSPMVPLNLFLFDL